jgi:hypothetical protein
LPEQIERLHQRHAGLEQGGQFLIEDQKLARRHAATPRHRQPEPGKGALGLQGENVEAFFFELVAQPRLAVGDVDPLDNLAAGRAEPTAEFHHTSVAYLLSD